MKTIKRIYAPGSDWIYIKIYTGISLSEEILLNVVNIINGLKKKGYLAKWFFIRYSDPDFHLRIRILVANQNHIGSIIASFHKKLKYWLHNNLIWKIQLDTYNREIERYGNLTMEESESLFYIDSECVTSIIRMLNSNESYRWMISISMIDRLLTDFLIDITSKQQIMNELSSSFKAEFGFNEFNAKQLNYKYREDKSTIESILNHSISTMSFVNLHNPIEIRSTKLVPLVKEIHSKLTDKDVNVSFHQLIKSYLHMMMNRLFKDRNRIYELIIYDYMNRYYISQIAKIKYNTLGVQK